MIYIPPWQMKKTGVKAGTLAVGSTVKLMEGGTAVDYLVVNQGIPGNSNLYDASCDGTWLLRKDIHSGRKWHTRDANEYESSEINTWLNGEFFNTLGSAEQAAIKQVKIPYCVGYGASTINSGTNGLSVKAFLLGGYEVGWTTSDVQNFPQDGAKLSYFESGTGTSANNKRIANLNGSADYWWLRSPSTDYTSTVWYVYIDGSYGNGFASNLFGIRPALVLPSNALFDGKTMLLKGVK